MIPTPRQSAAVVGASATVVASLVLVLSAWARCTDLGEPVRVHPAIRALDAGRRP